MLDTEGQLGLSKGFVEARNSVPIDGHLGQTEPMVQPATKVVRPYRGRFFFGNGKASRERGAEPQLP